MVPPTVVIRVLFEQAGMSTAAGNQQVIDYIFSCISYCTAAINRNIVESHGSQFLTVCQCQALAGTSNRLAASGN
jgi:hypothetical protein